MTASFADWTRDRSLQTMSTNAGASKVAFQTWRHFKEAFTPELVARAVEETDAPVERCLDPFGGSGTTALACQFLGVHPITIEVNPYLADLIAAKLTAYDADALVHTLGRVLKHAERVRGSVDLSLPIAAPKTMVEPGYNDRWIFDEPIAEEIAAILDAIDEVADAEYRVLLRVLLGGILLDVSNVVVNGKGRRYRRNWKDRRRSQHSVRSLFGEAVRRAANDVHRFGSRQCMDFSLVRGDARTALSSVESYDLAVFSPPYPNSFDYTDVYNLELWILGYLGTREDNRSLRQSTVCSHVQISRDFPPHPNGSRTLDAVLGHLDAKKEDLWDRRLPRMVAGYFADMTDVLFDVRGTISSLGAIWMVVGDSRYNDVLIPTAEILAELAGEIGLECTAIEPFRSMRASPQQGGRLDLSESLLILRPG